MMAGQDEPAPAGERQALPAVLPPDLNLFLFADVGVERSGMTLTVLSALARLDLDPWDEAGRLSRLSRAQAADNFAGRLAMLPAMPGWPQETKAETTAGTAARLVALLPQNGRLRPALAEPATETLRAPPPCRPTGVAGSGRYACTGCHRALGGGHWRCRTPGQSRGANQCARYGSH